MLRRNIHRLIATTADLLALAPLASYSQELPAEVRFAYAGGPRVWILGKIDQSFDKSFGTKVRWIPFATGADVLSLFAAKEIDIARFGSSPTVAGISRKLPIEIIGVPEVVATSERLIGRGAKGVNGLKDLEGKTVGYWLDFADCRRDGGGHLGPGLDGHERRHLPAHRRGDAGHRAAGPDGLPLRPGFGAGPAGHRALGGPRYMNTVKNTPWPLH